MGLCDVLDDAKPQSRTAGGAASRSVDSIEPLEDSVDLIAWNSNTGVRDKDLDALFSQFHLHVDVSGGRVFNRFVDQIECHLGLLGAVSFVLTWNRTFEA